VRTTPTHPQGVYTAANGTSKNGKELSRLLTAAIINQEFCSLLLANPAVAMAAGFNGQPFQLTSDDQELVLSIRAISLADFAQQLTARGRRNGNGHHSNGRSHKDTNGNLRGKVLGSHE
jgi:hypothetical protein